MDERHLVVPRTARIYSLGAVGPRTREVWVVLHGYRQAADRFLSRFVHLEAPHRLLVAPEGLSRFYTEADPGRHGPASRVGASWMTREGREAEIRDYVHYLNLLADELFEEVLRGDVHLTVLGFSQGLHTAARWAVLGRHPPDRLVLWGDYLPPDLPEEAGQSRLASMEVVWVEGAEDSTRREDLEREQTETLERWGIRYEHRVHPGGHELDADLLRRLAHEPDSRAPRRG